MKTTLDLPDDLVRSVKIRAVRENRRLKDVVADLLRRGLADAADRSAELHTRVRLPLVRCAHPAHPDEEMTPDRAAAVLLAQEVQGSAPA